MHIQVPNQADPVQPPIYDGDLDEINGVLPDGHYRAVIPETGENLSVTVKDGHADEVLPIL